MYKKYKFIDNNGTFILNNATSFKNLYFPLTNFHGLKSSITPSLNGDIKLNHNHFFLLPLSEIDLHNSFFGRNIWFKVNDNIDWALSGNSYYQNYNKDEVTIKAGFLYHQLERSNNLFKTITTSFVTIDDNIELHQVVFTNTSSKKITVKIISAVPIYGRSADNLRDHRHVTSLLNRAFVVQNGIINRPTLLFDERGHRINDTSYGIFIKLSKGIIEKYWPILDEFIGYSNLVSPDLITQSINSSHFIGEVVEGYEVIGALESSIIELEPKEKVEIKMALVIGKTNKEIENLAKLYLKKDFTSELNLCTNYWINLLDKLSFSLVNEDYSNWLKWVCLQPILRRIYGCSFLPHHDYGRGGRGWRDLWQDLLALILMEDQDIRSNIINNFAGIRIDGSNATIIGSKPGEFIADRNQIVRVWSDHAIWGLFTILIYLEYSGDIEILFLNQSYFKDKFSHYTRNINTLDNPNNVLLDKHGNIYEGSIFEHLLIQNIIPFYNVGPHGFVRLEDADWNDGMDMAKQNGETVAFTAFYAYNLLSIAELCDKLNETGKKSIDLIIELQPLLIENKANIDLSVKEKNNLLDEYFYKVKDFISGDKFTIPTILLASILRAMGYQFINNIRETEWYQDDRIGWFNGYYDNDSIALDNFEMRKMGLTGQVFTILSGTATNEMVEKQIKAVDTILYDHSIPGYRLNSNYNELKTNMGRLFGFAYGSKENGAVFSHMVIMYAFALYSRGFVDAGYRVISSVYDAINNPNSKIYPGIPEYFNNEGRGMYHYLTGSASWLIFTMTNQIFGIKGDYGTLVFEPKLVKEQFINYRASIRKVINKRIIDIIYINEFDLNYQEYEINAVFIDGKNTNLIHFRNGVKVNIFPEKQIKIILGKKKQYE